MPSTGAPLSPLIPSHRVFSSLSGKSIWNEHLIVEAHVDFAGFVERKQVIEGDEELEEELSQDLEAHQQRGNVWAKQ